MVIKLGIVGMSEGNGHPFSFSAITNGYSESDLANSGWPVIYQYVKKRDPSEFGFEGVRITHAWTQDISVTDKLCKACNIPNRVESLENMTDYIDGVIVARDDYEKHFEMAMPFLKKGKYVFIDKPLSLDFRELEVFKEYLANGQLMSCSGMRYAIELDDLRANISSYGEIKLIRGAVLNSWEKYGIHLLDAVFGVIPNKPIAVTVLPSKHDSMAITLDNGALFQMDSLGSVPKTFRIDLWGTDHWSSHDIYDNFSMFRRTIWHFVNSIRKKQVAIPVAITIDNMRILIAGQISKAENRTVLIDEIQL